MRDNNGGNNFLNRFSSLRKPSRYTGEYENGYGYDFENDISDATVSGYHDFVFAVSEEKTDNEEKSTSGIMSEDRFYIDLEKDLITWIYHNPDAVSGDQFVINIFNLGLFHDAIDRSKNENGIDIRNVFDLVETECRQFLIDVGSHTYELYKAKFMSRPAAIGMTRETAETIELYFKARDIIELYCIDEFNQTADFGNSNAIGVAYTTTEDDKHEIQVYANLADHRHEMYFDGELIAMQKADSLAEYVNMYLEQMSFDDLTSVPRWVIDKYEKKGAFRTDMDFMQLHVWDRTYKTCLEADNYYLGQGLYLQLYTMENGELEPYADITVNLLDFPTEGDCAFVDTNNFPQVESLIRDYNLGEKTGRIGRSGYCTYPEYRFNKEELKKYCINPENIKERPRKNRRDAR